METGKRQFDIEELFRQKLDNAEVIPGASVNDELMRKLARKEFLRFNPARFNIYYLGAIAAGLITAGLLLFSEPGKEESGETVSPVQVETSMVPVQAEIKQQVVSVSVNPEAKIRNTRETLIVKDNEAVIDENIPFQEIPDKSLPSGITSPVAKEIVLNEKTEPDKLQVKSSSVSALFMISASSGCAPLKVSFGSVGAGYSKYSWTFGDGGTSGSMEPEWIYEVEGQYTATLSATDASGRTTSWSVPVHVYPRPKAQFEILPEKAVLPIDEIRFNNFSSGAAEYTWDFGDGTSSTQFEPVHKYVKYGNYDVRLVAFSENGCSDTLLLKNAFSGSDYFINMPNAFIPNPYGPSGGHYSLKSDETAEIFHPEFSGVADFQLRIFSKTGILIFESNDINIGWDGYFKGELCNAGVYVWRIRGNFSSGEPFNRMGDVTIIKK